jgi:hypothetical protein
MIMCSNYNVCVWVEINELYSLGLQTGMIKHIDIRTYVSYTTFYNEYILTWITIYDIQLVAMCDVYIY